MHACLKNAIFTVAISLAGVSMVVADESAAVPSPYYLQDGVQFFPATPAPKPAANELTQRLNAILTRLGSIEDRLSRIEADQSVFKGWGIDGRGVIRLPDGRPVGFWGIDAPSTMDRR